MTIILFLVDTSASMCQKALVGGVKKSYLDIAKGAVETFLKIRQRSQDCVGDRYMLLTFEDPPNNVKAGWQENHATFMNELKNLQSNGLTSMGEALKNAFDLLNLNRALSGIDTYGQGRCPFYLEPSIIIVLTDGGKYAFRNGVQHELILPLNAQTPGTKLTKEPFRWDQRLFSLVLRMPGNRVDERLQGKVPHDESMIEKMCEVTGGRSYKIKSHYVLNQCLESLVQKIQPGVVIHFEQVIAKSGVRAIDIQPTKCMIYVPKQNPSQKTFPVRYWPIPEPYWPDPKLTSLPPRDAHPRVKVIWPSCDEPQVLRNFPIDRYEVETCPLTAHIISMKETNKVWPLVIATGVQGEMPFGYLKASNTHPSLVHLYVMPYNYQMIVSLVNDLVDKFNFNPPTEWVYKFSNYVKTIPQYYCPFLRRALVTALNVPHQLLQYILPESFDSYLSPSVANYLKHMKNTAQQAQKHLCLRVLKQLKEPKQPFRQIETVTIKASVQRKRDILSHPMLKDTFTKMHMEIDNYDNFSIMIPSTVRTATTSNCRNPYDITRRELFDGLARMRQCFFRLLTGNITLFTKDSGHCMPISNMGHYQDYLKNKPTSLRQLEPTDVCQHLFGNPCKKNKRIVMVDEADLNDVGSLKSVPSDQGDEKNTASRMKDRKRKAGPIHKDYVYKRLVPSNRCSALEVKSELTTTDCGSGSGTTSDSERLVVLHADTGEVPATSVSFRENSHYIAALKEMFAVEMNAYSRESQHDVTTKQGPADRVVAQLSVPAISIQTVVVDSPLINSCPHFVQRDSSSRINEEEGIKCAQVDQTSCLKTSPVSDDSPFQVAPIEEPPDEKEPTECRTVDPVEVHSVRVEQHAQYESHQTLDQFKQQQQEEIPSQEQPIILPAPELLPQLKLEHGHSLSITRPQLPSNKSSISMSSAEDVADMSDVLNKSNIIKTCRNEDNATEEKRQTN
ncbi:integrator complex subunit 6-like [Anopheles bellator]|uniref:integrator complex subunit 6-like n=1 Tax=Anopheles bellator TaxID=139047 RepID=UPI00264940F9|nr:integrator complex subunit 6-like [Anopheles bellator]